MSVLYPPAKNLNQILVSNRLNQVKNFKNTMTLESHVNTNVIRIASLRVAKSMLKTNHNYFHEITNC